jgi:cysteine desulfurase
MKHPLYFDYAATTPVDERVLQQMLPWFNQRFGNAASKAHAYGWEAEEAVTLAREEVAALIGCEKEEIIFTSGATESCNLALRGVTEAYGEKRKHIITCTTEHKAVLDTCDALEKKGFLITRLGVDSNGLPDAAALSAALTPDTLLLALMYANNETGIIHPVKQLAALAKEKGVFVFCDATQAVGKIPLSVTDEGIDLLALSAHKCYGPKGIGALYIRRKNPRIQLKAQLTGGGHERGFRSGTLNVPAIVGLGAAAGICRQEMDQEQQRLLGLRRLLEQHITEKLPVTINGEAAHRLPHISNICFRVQNGATLLGRLHTAVAAAAGSACSSASGAPSHVLMAMGLSELEARSSIRFSLGRFTTEAEVLTAVQAIVAAAE